MGDGSADSKVAPSILVFATNSISDPGIDMAGSTHMPYPTSVKVIAIPCSSGVDPRWVLHAIKTGFDGVFIAADGMDCALLHDCTSRTSAVVQKSQELLKEHDYDPRRLKMAAICSVCAESFVSHIKSFAEVLTELQR